MTGQEETMAARRIRRAWTMMLRHTKAGNTETASAWMAEWQRLCNEHIAAVQMESSDWLGSQN